MSSTSFTYSQALKGWLSSYEKAASLGSQEELRSARNFARAFEIWYNKG
jgi:hypothetical protein